MKNLLLFSIVMFLFSVINAQNYSVSITSPTSGSIVSGSVVDNYQSSVNVNFTYSGQKANQQNSWKIKVYRDFVVGMDNENTFYKLADNTIGAWVDEGSSSTEIPVLVARNNPIFIALYEAEPNSTPNQWIFRAGSTANGSYYLRPAQKVYVENNFGSGVVKVNGSNYSTGSSFDIWSSSLSLEAVEGQSYSGYNMIWSANSSNQSNWTKVLNSTNQYHSSNKSCTYSLTQGENGVTLKAGLLKQCNFTSNAPLTFQSTYYPAGTDIHLIEGVPSTITVSSTFISSDYMVRQFTSWADNNSTSTSRDFTINDHSTVNVNSSAVKPDNGYKSMNYTGNVGDNITITWNEHPNSNVTQYQVWRKVKHNGVMGSAALLATVSRGTTSFTDGEYVYTSGYTDDLLYYDIRAYYQPNSSYADYDFQAVYGKFGEQASKYADKSGQKMMSSVPSEYELGSYPNPFNPTTVIRYSMPEAGQVSLKVYNILSQEVANLVEETKSAGVHTVNFNANNLPTGIYIARLQAGSKVMSIKLQLVK